MPCSLTEIHTLTNGAIKRTIKNLVYLHETKDCFACIYHMHGVLKQQTNHQPIFMTMTNRNIYYHCIWHHLTRSARLIHGQGVWSDYSIVCNQWSNPANKIKMEEPQRDALPYCVISVVYWWLMLDHWLPLYILPTIASETLVVSQLSRKCPSCSSFTLQYLYTPRRLFSS